jgi:hypothetical protein
MKNPWILPASALLLGALGGYISGRNTRPAADTDTAEPTVIRTRPSARPENSPSEARPGNTRRINSSSEINLLAGSSNRIQALIDFYSRLDPQQLEEEARKLDDLPVNERIISSFVLFGRWAEVDPTAAMSFSNTMGFSGMFVRPTILQSWASVDPANAANYYATNPREFAMMGMMGRGPMGGQGAASIIAAEWARQDPAAAIQWAQSLTTEKSQAISAVVGEIAKTDPAKAVSMLSTLGGADLRDAYSTIAAPFGASDFGQAQAWIRTLPADQQADALASAIRGLSGKDPREAARQLGEMPDGEAKHSVIDKVVGDLARDHPVEAARLLEGQTDENVLRDGMRELMPSWVARDPAAALAYADSRAPGRVRDGALQSYIWSNRAAAPADLVRVAESIGNEGDRNRSIAITAARWMSEDQAAATSYIRQSTMLAEETKTRILEGRGMRGRGRRGD